TSPTVSDWSPGRRRRTGLTASTCACSPMWSRSTWRPGRWRFATWPPAPGPPPGRPPFPVCDDAGVFGVQTLDAGAALLAGLERLRPRRAVVIGGGYIGVEMAEALARRHLA